ncbi:hypothetical protein KC19_4G260200 [Ceratodon purpureus]|uniref:Uncharacterized protein n=1 Tax=Ceratodon purpureus TaxID=3225 RepID=A0A8T0IFD7_CERPU|nr:hypothetical protein KC19_4G260200 [Ceratodon purpureus]
MTTATSYQSPALRAPIAPPTTIHTAADSPTRTQPLNPNHPSRLRPASNPLPNPPRSGSAETRARQTTKQERATRQLRGQLAAARYRAPHTARCRNRVEEGSSRRASFPFHPVPVCVCVLVSLLVVSEFRPRHLSLYWSTIKKENDALLS